MGGGDLYDGQAALLGVDDQYNALDTLHLGKTRYPLYRRLGGPQGCF